MELNDFLTLLTPSGQNALRAAEALEPKEAGFLGDFQKLVRRFPPELARAALETAILRREAQKKFPFSEKLYATRAALEQATPYPVSHYRAARFTGFDSLLDLGCSVGGDTLALAEQAFTVGVDLDPLRLQMARANLDALGLDARAAFVQANLRDELPAAPGAHRGLFFDPARRVEGQRIFSVEDYSPPLAVIDGWLARFEALGVKISPGVQIDQLSAYEQAAEIEFISLKGELKEAVLWFGPLKSTARRATLLPGPFTLESSLTFTAWNRQSAHRLLVGPPRAYLYEPDAAVIRAGLVEDLGLQLSAAQFDPSIAYLTSDERVSTPFARVWEVEDWFPFQLKRLRATLRERGVGQVTVKKRGSPLTPEELIHSLRLKGDATRVVFLTQLQGQPVVVICR